VTWQLGSFAILALALAGGFAWYERGRPDARIVALVGTLAAFGALGRIAFAAIPNVKPTTDIVLISGYALGGAPGFVVGAVAALTSNFFFGQGPWTPWQMAAWGLTGVLGAGLASVTGRRIGRWPLAIVCGVVGFAFTATQDFGDWVTYSDHSLAQLGVYVGKGLGFDGIHAAGCVVFALAFGPALARSIERFARRLHVTWQPVVPAAVVLVIALAGGGLSPPAARAGATPVSYLLAAQNSDGGFGGAPGQPSSELFSGWAALGLASEGVNLQHVGGLVHYLQVGSVSDVGSLERTILALHAAGQPVASLAPRLEGDLAGNGSVQNQTNLTSFAVMALRAAGTAPPPRTLTWLAGQQDSDGGFNFATAGGASDVDDTGAALEALGANARAVRFLRRAQNPGGGFPSDPGADSNAQSTAWAAQGLLAAGVDLGSLPHGSPLSYLRGMIAPDGHVRYSSSTDQTPVWVTGEALMALAGKPLPVAPAAVTAPASNAATPAHSDAHSRHVVRDNKRRAAAHSRSRRRSGKQFGAGAASSSGLDGLAVDAGVLAALVLAPIGQ
jgi:energy-coupling factor transport system substrate-specific component